MPTIKPLMIAHRGASAYAPENTLSSFLLAIAQGCDAIELDVHLTKDQKLVVFHNEELANTTNGKGIIGEMTAYELRQLDAGAWFHHDFTGEKIPFLDEVVDLVPPHIMINVELKNIPSYYIGIEEAVVDLVRKKNAFERIVVSSFDHQCLLKVKELEPRLKIGLLYQNNLYSHIGYATQIQIPIYSLHPQYECIKKSDIQLAVENNLHVFPWTVNHEQEMKKLIKCGVSGIMTDDLLLLKKAMSS